MKKCPADTCWKAGGRASTGHKCPGQRAPTCTNAGLPADGPGQSLREGSLGHGLEGEWSVVTQPVILQNPAGKAGSLAWRLEISGRCVGM